MEIVLASKSPRRKELLEQIGLEFTVIPAEGDETFLDLEAEDIVKGLSRQKAREVQRSHNIEGIIIGADTVVVHKGDILGKPSDPEYAYRMLKSLQGECHKVYTGVTLLCQAGGQTEEVTFAECTEVEFYEMSEGEILRYIASREPMDKAGAYGIQGRGGAFVRRIVGDYNNVVGLPVARVYHELKERGWI